MKKRYPTIIFCLFFFILNVSFVSTNTYLNENTTWQTDLLAVSFASMVFGDLNDDNNLDLVMIGHLPSSKIYINNETSLGENFTWEQNLTNVAYGSLALGDIDNDGDLDLALMGCGNGGGTASLCDPGAYYSFIYINNGTSLVENSTWGVNLVNTWKGTLAFGDIDNDGKLDLAMTGQSETEGKISKIYINNGSSLEENSTWQQDLVALHESSLAWGDVDNDNKLDLIMVGDAGNSDERAKVYINNGSSLAENSTWQTNLLGTEHSSISFGDFNNNGRLDLTLIGKTSHDNHEIYNNTGTTFELLQTEAAGTGDLSGVFEGSQSFGDYDNDGYLDLITTGKEGHTTLFVYNVSSNAFTTNLNDPETGLLNLQFGSSIVWVDLDNDSDLDLIETGYIEEGINANRIKIYINNITTSNNVPNASTDFNTTYSNTELTLQWDNASDSETATLGLYYNLKVGTASNKHSIVTGVYGGGNDNGYFGNMMQRKSITLKNIDISGNDTIFWSVQTIDTGLKAGDWSVEQNYTLPVDITRPEITLNAPVNQFNTTNPIITFNTTVYDDTNLTNVSLYGNWSGWHSNETNSSGDNNTDYIFTKNLTSYGDGDYQWLIEAYDKTNNSRNSSIRNIRIDTSYPLVNLVTPINASSWTSSQTVTFTYNVTDLAILNCSLIIDGSIDQNDTSITVNTAQTFNKTLFNGNYNWSINCTDTVNYENSSEIRELTVSYTAPVPEGGGGSNSRSSSTITTVEEEMEEAEESVEEEIPPAQPPSSAEEEVIGEEIVKETEKFEWKESYLWKVPVVVGLIIISLLFYYWGKKK